MVEGCGASFFVDNINKGCIFTPRIIAVYKEVAIRYMLPSKKAKTLETLNYFSIIN